MLFTFSLKARGGEEAHRFNIGMNTMQYECLFRNYPLFSIEIAEFC